MTSDRFSQNKMEKSDGAKSLYLYFRMETEYSFSLQEPQLSWLCPFHYNSEIIQTSSLWREKDSTSSQSENFSIHPRDVKWNSYIHLPTLLHVSRLLCLCHHQIDVTNGKLQKSRQLGTRIGIGMDVYTDTDTETQMFDGKKRTVKDGIRSNSKWSFTCLDNIKLWLPFHSGHSLNLHFGLPPSLSPMFFRSVDGIILHFAQLGLDVIEYKGQSKSFIGSFFILMKVYQIHF